MRISFDLDDTLVCRREGVLHETRPTWYRRLLTSREHLRQGTCNLFRALQGRGWEIWIYTTSHRSSALVRCWLRSYGLHVARVINQDAHDRQIPRPLSGRRPSKHPGFFGIDLHVDDSDGVRLEGDEHNFRVLVIDPFDPDWTARVLEAADSLYPP